MHYQNIDTQMKNLLKLIYPLPYYEPTFFLVVLGLFKNDLSRGIEIFDLFKGGCQSRGVAKVGGISLK